MDLTGIKRIVFTEEQIKNRVAELGKQISQDYKDKYPILISVLKGTMYLSLIHI